MDSIPELQKKRALYERHLKSAIHHGSDNEVVQASNSLLEIDEQLNPSKDEPMTWKGESN